MSKRLCVCGLLLVLLVGSTPLLARPPQVEQPPGPTSWWASIVPDWLDELLSVVAGGVEAGSPVDSQPTTKTPPTQLEPPSSLTEEDGATTENGPGMEPGG
jgi:hypothetical protein